MKSKFLEFCYIFIGKVFKIINLKKPKILIYADSRGFDVVGKYGKNPFKSYIKDLILKYNTDFFICPEKHTTILDFLDLLKNIDLKKYNFIILHCGVVDFSPRPLSNLNWILKTKTKNSYFKIVQNNYSEYYSKPSETFYKNELTQNLYSESFLQEVVLPELNKIKNLIWINSNHFVKGWEGNFTKGRPLNIEDYVSVFDLIMKKNLNQIVDLKKWSENEIKKYTIDNIHYTKAGFNQVSKLILKKIKSIYES